MRVPRVVATARSKSGRGGGAERGGLRRKEWCNATQGETRTRAQSKGLPLGASHRLLPTSCQLLPTHGRSVHADRHRYATGQGATNVATPIKLAVGLVDNSAVMSPGGIAEVAEGRPCCQHSNTRGELLHKKGNAALSGVRSLCCMPMDIARMRPYVKGRDGAFQL